MASGAGVHIISVCWSARYIESLTQKAAFHQPGFENKDQELELARVDLTIHAHDFLEEGSGILRQSTIRMTGCGEFDSWKGRLQSTSQVYHQGAPICVANDKLPVMLSAISDVSADLLRV